MEESKLVCALNPGNLLSSFCVSCQVFTCPECEWDHMGHKDVMHLFNLKAQLVEKRDDITNTITQSKEAYEQNLSQAQTIIKTVQAQFDEKKAFFARLMENIQKAFTSSEKAVTKEIETRTAKIRDFPSKCTSHLEIIKTICECEQLFDTNLDPETLKTFCMEYAKEHYKLQVVLDNLDKDIKEMKGSFNIFSRQIDRLPSVIQQTLEPVFLYSASHDVDGVNVAIGVALKSLHIDKKQQFTNEDCIEVCQFVYKSFNLTNVPSNQELVNRLPSPGEQTVEQLREFVDLILKTQAQSNVVT